MIELTLINPVAIPIDFRRAVVVAAHITYVSEYEYRGQRYTEVHLVNDSRLLVTQSVDTVKQLLAEANSCPE